MTISEGKNFHEVESITKKDLRKTFFASMPFYLAFGMERQGNVGFLLTVLPVLRRLYKGQPDKLKESMVRNNELFAIADQFLEFVAGIVLSMEEKNAKTDDFDTSAISNMKVALMGPLAGIGDSVFLGTLRLIAMSVGISLMSQGNLIGLILFLLIWNVPCWTIKYLGTFLGYRLGADFVERISANGVITKFMDAVGILGMLAIGGMAVTTVSVNFIMPLGATGTTLQSVLDTIMPNCCGLALVWLTYGILRKKVSPLVLIFGIMAVCIVFSGLGIM